MQAKFNEIIFTDADIVNKEDFIPAGEYNPHNVRPFLLHDAGFTITIVFADSLQDAMDIAVDEGKLDFLQIDPADANDRSDYMTEIFADADTSLDENCPEYTSVDGIRYWWKETPSFLGNASEPFDIESLGAVELPNPGFSFVALFNANTK